MKRFAFAFALFTAIAGSALQGQTIYFRANIPFDFRMGEKLMPAGVYTIQHSGASPVLSLQSTGTNHAALALTIPSLRSAVPNTGQLTFNRYGDTYFLSKIWTAGSRAGLQLPKTSSEKKVARNAGLLQTAHVSAPQR